jgi:hypothetical protein
LYGQGGAYSERGKALFLGTDGSKRFFFEKRSKKLLLTVGYGNAGAKARSNKSFLVLFFKKERLALT